MTTSPRKNRAVGAGRAGRGCLGALAGLSLLLIALYLLHAPLLRGVAELVEAEDAPRRADLIYLLNGDAQISARSTHAAALYRAGYAPLVVVARVEELPAVAAGDYPNETDVNVRTLRREGVPASAVRMLRIPGGVTSTRDEAAVLAAYLRSHPAERVLVVTTEFHTRRAGWLVRRALRGTEVEVRVAGARHPRFHSGNWWRSEVGLLSYVEEYLKFVHNFLAG